MDEMLPAISASDQRRLVAAYGGSTSFQYEPYVMHLRSLVEVRRSCQRAELSRMSTSEQTPKWICVMRETKKYILATA